MLAIASGTVAIGGGELDVWRVWGELVVGAVCGEFGLCGVSEGASGRQLSQQLPCCELMEEGQAHLTMEAKTQD